MEKTDDIIVAKKWSKNNVADWEKNFYRFPFIRSRSCRLIFGEDDMGRRDWREYWTIEKYLKDVAPVEKALSICCGFGHVERFLSKLNAAKKITGSDITAGAIEQAKKNAAEENITNIDYYVSDLNSEILPPNEYDLVWSNGAVHHIKNIEHCISQLYSTLKPGGYLICNEYVGPDYQQIGLRQQQVINAVRHLMPSSFVSKEVLTSRSFVEKVLKKLGLKNKEAQIYDLIYKPIPLSWFAENDPSESVRSSQIILNLKKHFKQVEIKGYGGSVLYYALGKNFYDTYDNENPVHRNFLEMIFKIEDALIAAGELQHDNAHIICRKI